jgi:putative FmdB family regulatory protein
MPAYDYLCDGCGCRFEMRQKMSDAAIESCPQCAGSVRRLISGGAGAITKSSSQHFTSSPATRGMCEAGGRCCGQGEACGGGMFCNN